jgi:hypothetical protein
VEIKSSNCGNVKEIILEDKERGNHNKGGITYTIPNAAIDKTKLNV